MKAPQKLHLFLFAIISILIIILLLQNIGNKEKKSPKHIPHSFQLMEITHSSVPQKTTYGIVQPANIVEVQMEVSGKVDADNSSLAPGRTFKKNEILIKVNRLDILYQLVIQRLKYKKRILNFISLLKKEAPKEIKKWLDFEREIHKAETLPRLPSINSAEEKHLADSLLIYKEYFITKALGLKAEKHLYAAPFNGRIIKSNIGPGGMVREGKTLLKIAKRSPQQVVAVIPLQSLRKYESSKIVYFRNANADTVGTGILDRTGTQLSDSGFIKTYFKITSSSNLPLHKKIEIVSPTQKEGILVPNTAVVNGYSFLYNKNGVFKTKVKVIAEKKDSMQIRGLPSPCFLIVNPEALDSLDEL